MRWRAKLGAFRPPVSFEHGPNGWETLYTTNASAINSWVGEELGGVGMHCQTGWRTTFSALSLQLELPGRIGLIAQSMHGRTYAGPKLSGVHAIDNDFQGHFVLLTKRSGRRRVSVRRDWFEIDDRDLSGIDPNGDDGRGWTLSYQFAPNDAWMLGLEWLEIDSCHPARVFEQAPVDLTERGWFLVLRWRH